MTLIVPAQIGVLASGLFDLIGPFLIFGIYIIVSIAKATAKKEQAGDSEEAESELKKAVRRRYQEIYLKQVGQAPQESSKPQRKPQYVQSQPKQEIEPTIPQHRYQWEIRQQAIRERNIKSQPRKIVPKRPQASILKQVSAAVSKPKSKQLMHQEMAKTGNLLVSMIKEPGNLRSAIVLKEILDKPLALREV